MCETIVILVSGEVLANGHDPSIENQRENARAVAEGLAPIFSSSMQVILLHGNKPQVGFVLLRSEVASHVLHSIPLDVCGADTQGATGYMLRLAMLNVMKKQGVERKITCVLTHTLVDAGSGDDQPPSAIGPFYDRTRAFQFREARQWEIIEEEGRGYRRVVPSLQPVDILEMESIRQLTASGDIVIAAGGGGIPVAVNDSGELAGVEAVVATEYTACLLAKQMDAKILLMIVEKARKYILSGLNIDPMTHLTLEQLDQLLEQGTYPSRSVRSKLQAASEFLHSTGQQVMITTLDKLPQTLQNKAGLWIGSFDPVIR